MARALKVLLAVIAAITLLVVVGVRVVTAVIVWQTVDPALEQVRSEATEHWPQVRADLDEVARDPFFTKRRSGGDASELLNELMAFKGEHEERAPSSERLALPADLAQRAREVRLDDPGTFPEAAELATLDFGWLKDLGAYSHWELTTHPLFAKASAIDGVSMPLPDFVSLRAWATLRLVDGVQRGELGAAREEVRHLAWLCATTENLVGAMIAAALLKVEDKARATHAPEEPAAAPATDAFKRATWALWALQHEAVPAELRASATAKAKGSLAQCVAASEIANTEPFQRALLYDYYPEIYAERDALRASPPAPCRFLLARRAQAADPAASPAMDADTHRVYRALTPATSLEAALDALFMRPVRHTIGLILQTIATPDGYKLYREADPHRREE